MSGITNTFVSNTALILAPVPVVDVVVFLVNVTALISPFVSTSATFPNTVGISVGTISPIAYPVPATSTVYE